MQTNDAGTVDRTIAVGTGGRATCPRIEDWITNFAENEFPAMNDKIMKCLEEYEAEASGQ